VLVSGEHWKYPDFYMNVPLESKINVRYNGPVQNDNLAGEITMLYKYALKQ
jgi:hypothetical protein